MQKLAAKEIYRVAEKGCRAVAWSELPAWLGRPGLHGDFWDPFLKACEDTQTVILYAYRFRD